MKNEKCPTCGTMCEVKWYGLDMVEQTGDETLASKGYTPLPAIPAASVSAAQSGTIKYFIEDMRTGKWLTIGDMFDSSKLEESSASRWTDNPQMAVSWDTREEAEAHNKQYWDMADIEVTEHEFVAPLSDPESAATAPVMQQGEGDAPMNIDYKEGCEILAKKLVEVSKNNYLFGAYLRRELAKGTTHFVIATHDYETGDHWYIHPENKAGETFDLYLTKNTLLEYAQGFQTLPTPASNQNEQELRALVGKLARLHPDGNPEYLIKEAQKLLTNG